MFKFKIGTKVQGAEYMQGSLMQISEGKIVKRKRWSNENWYTIDSGDVFLEDQLMEIKTLDDAIYDAIEETHCSLQQLTDDELIDCRKVLEKRLENVLFTLQRENHNGN